MKFSGIKIEYIHWYDYIWLWFLPTHLSMDGGNATFYKFWKGKIYILGFWEEKK